MLKPNKHSHPDKTVINVSLIIIDKLRKERICKYNALLGHVKEKATGCRSLFLPSLSFLYLVGLIEYHPKTDSFEYVGSK